MSKINRLLRGLLALGISLAVVGEAAAERITESRDVADFQAIEFAGSGDLILTQGAEESLTIEADDDVMSSIITEVKDGVLYIHRKKFSGWHFLGLFRGDDSSRYDLSFKTLESLRLSGSGDVRASHIEGADFAVKISGSGEIDLADLDVDSLEIRVNGSGELRVRELMATSLKSRITGSGDVEIGGQVGSQEISVTGSGDHYAPDLQSETVAARIAGSGSVDVWVTDELQARVSGSGNVIYRGDPEVNSRISGSGEVEQR